MSIPYLPGRKVRRQAVQVRNSYLLWGVYLLTFMWVSLQLERGSALHTAAIVLGIAIPSIYSAWFKRTIARYNLEAASAISALQREQAAAAERTFSVLLARFRWPKLLRNLTLYNLGLAQYRQGRYDDAIASLVEADRGGGAFNIDPSLASTLGIIHALRGDLEVADRWSAEAQIRYAGQVANASFPNLIAETVIALRHGEFDEVHRRLERDWAEIENTRKGETLRPLRLFRAFATARVAAITDSQQLAALVVALQPAGATDFAYLGVEWPELYDFIARAFPPTSAIL